VTKKIPLLGESLQEGSRQGGGGGGIRPGQGDLCSEDVPKSSISRRGFYEHH